MIVNMPVNGATGGVHPHPPVTTSNNNNNINNNDTNTTNNNNLQQTQCEFNFLKRKYETDQQQQLDQQQHQQQTPDYEEQLVANPWKKRHLDYDGDMCFQLQLETNNPTATGTGTGTGSETTTTTASVAAVTTSISSSSSSSFINDLFAYDSSLLVPAASYCAPPSAPMEAGDAGGWQTGELLELDHRYNSGLQTEIAQLNATLPPPQQQQQQHQDLSGNSFLVPQKQTLSMPQARQVACGRRSSPAASESEPDFEDKNLSWLLNFKFDEFPHLSPDVGGAGVGQRLGGATGLEAATPTAAANMASASPCSSASPASASNSNHSLNSSSQSCHTTLLLEQRGSPKSCSSASTIGALTAITNGTGGGSGVTALNTTTTTKTGRKFEELVMEVTSEMDGNDMIVAEHVIVEDTTSKAPKKPPFTYTELIEYALEDKGELTVSGIYQWISDRFPYYKSNDDRWKNSVRHNLSINPHFRKGVKAPQGAGHLWAISSGDSAENVLAWEHKKQRLDLFFKMESINRERLQQHQQQMQQQQLQQQQQQQQHQQCSNSPEQQQQQQTNATNCIYDEAAVAAAALTQEMLQHTTPSETSPSHHHHHQQHQQHHQHNHHHHQQQQQSQPQQQQRLLPFSDLLSDEELRKTAGQILNGIHREVEVQSVNSIISTYQDVLLDNEDYLNPIHKDVVVTESGLRQHQHHHQHHNQQQQHSHQQQPQQQQQQQHSSGSSNGCSSNSILANSLTHSQYYITEIDPMELGIQMSHHQVEPSEEEVLFSDDFNLNYFGYNPGSDIVA